MADNWLVSMVNLDIYTQRDYIFHFDKKYNIGDYFCSAKAIL